MDPQLEARLHELSSKYSDATSKAVRLGIEKEMLEATTGLECCPDWWHWACNCDTCLSYADDEGDPPDE